jgi:hypothetical protein
MSPMAFSDPLSMTLGVAAPMGLQVLSKDDRNCIVELIEAAKSRQSSSLDRAIDDGLSHLPRLLRRPLRLLIFG